MSRHIKKNNWPGLGDALKAHRQNRGLKLRDVAEKCGVTESCVCYWEGGVTEPSIYHLWHMARLYGITIDELIEKP